MNEIAPVRALTVRDLRELLADLPDTTEVYIETIVGGDLGTDDIPLMDVALTTTPDGYYVRLLPDPTDPYGTRDLIDHGLAAREEEGAMSEECTETARILTDNECLRIVQVSIAEDRLLNGPDGGGGYGPDPLLALVEHIVRDRMAQAWDEGWRTGRGRGPGHTDACPTGGWRSDNPYTTAENRDLTHFLDNRHWSGLCAAKTGRGTTNQADVTCADCLRLLSTPSGSEP